MSDNPMSRLRPSEWRRSAKRQRWYPRTLEVMRRLEQPGARIIFGRNDGRYRINGGRKRCDTVQPRTMEKLLRRAVIQSTPGSPHLVLTERGRRVLDRYRTATIEVSARRISRNPVRRFERKQSLEVVLFDGSNLEDVRQLVGAEITVGNAGEATLGDMSLKPQEHYVVRDEQGRIQLMSAKTFVAEMAKQGWNAVSRQEALNCC